MFCFSSFQLESQLLSQYHDTTFPLHQNFYVSNWTFCDQSPFLLFILLLPFTKVKTQIDQSQKGSLGTKFKKGHRSHVK